MGAVIYHMRQRDKNTFCKRVIDRFLPIMLFSMMVFSMLSCLLHAAFEVRLPPKISIKVESDVLVEGQQIPLIVTVIHSGSQKISQENITFDEPIISISRIGEEILNPSNIYSKDLDEAPAITRFRVILPAKKSGIYTLGPIHLRMGEFVFDSSDVTVNVQTALISPDFQLSAKVLNQDKVVYPGQSFTVEYRLTFKVPMRILKEDLPLLRVKGLIQEGSPEIQSFQEGSLYVQRIQQKLKAVSSGVFESGISVIEAMRVIDKGYGKELMPPLYRAEAPSITIQVAQFPEKGRPQTFYGAIGSFAWRSRLITNPITQVGDSIEVEYRVSGRGDLSSVHFPPKEVMEQLEEEFIIDSWPDTGTEEHNTKTFLLRLKARMPGEFIIRGLTVSSFDPSAGKYLTVNALPIQIQVKGREGETFSSNPKAPIEIGVTYPLQPLEIHPLDLSRAHWNLYDFVWALFICGGGVAIQLALKAYTEKMRGADSGEIKDAKTLFEQGFLKRSRTKESLTLLRRAIYMRLFEVGLAENIYDSPAQLDIRIPLVQEARDVLSEIDEYLYKTSSFPSQETKQELYDNIAFIYHKLKALPGKQK